MRTVPAFLALGVSAFLGSAQDSSAQTDAAWNAAMSQMLGTIRVSSQPMMTNGALAGCTLVFDALHQDQAYRQGQFIKVSGNVGIMGMGGTLGAIVKVVLTDVDKASFALTPASPAPTRAYIIADDYSNNLASLISASGSDTPGAVFAVYQIEPAFQIVMAGLERGKLTFAFNRGDGRTDIILPIEIAVSDMQADGSRVRSPDAERDFLSCLGALIASVQK